MKNFERRVAAAKRKSLLQPLLGSARRLSRLAVEYKDGPKPRPAHLALYPHIESDGTRPSTLATRVGITPQAVAQLVGDLEELGLVERLRDPEDRRATRVAFTDAGKRDILDGFESTAKLESVLRSRFGARDFDRLRTLLARLEALLQELEQPKP